MIKIIIDWNKGSIITFDDAGFARFFVGPNESNEVIVKLSQDGYDVRSATLDQLLIDSSKPNFIIAKEDTVTVIRSASSDSGYEDVESDVFNAAAFIAFWNVPGASPEFKQQTPYISFNTSGADSGKIIGGRRALYDPSTGVVRFFVDATTIHPTYSTSESIEFSYFLLNRPIL